MRPAYETKRKGRRLAAVARTLWASTVAGYFNAVQIKGECPRKILYSNMMNIYTKMILYGEYQGVGEH